MTEMGEYLVGAYLKIKEECDFIEYNLRSPEVGLQGLLEIDVVGIRLGDSTAFLCEVATHLQDLLYGQDNKSTIDRIKKKLEWQKEYAKLHLKTFKNVHLMFWSPKVPNGDLTRELEKLERIEKLEVVVNGEYTRRVNALREIAKPELRKKTDQGGKDIGNPFFRALQMGKDIGNPFFRALQILEHLQPAPGEFK